MYDMTEPHPSAAAFRAARDLLLRHRDDYETATREFSWPALDEFNWALDWFDVIAAEHPDRLALRIVADGDAAAQLSYGELAARSSQVANWLSDLGARRGDRLLLMLGNIAPLWEVILAAMKLGVVIIPASTLLGTADLADRIARGDVRHVVTEASHCPKFDGLAAAGPRSRWARGRAAGHRTAGSRTRTRPIPRRRSPRTASPGPPIRCCSTSSPARPPRVMPPTCPMGRSVRDCHGHSRTDRQACRPGPQHVAALAEHL
jgi:acyl-CoA synthetase (AMP-forming)/AMP-acid ligase II